jgi:hypothetical protein
MSWLSSFMHPGRPYQAAQDQMQQYYQQAQGQMQPFIQQGQQAGTQLGGAMQQLLDPQALQDKWMQSYETSAQAKNMQDQAQQSGLNAASSMGLMGSSPAMQALQQGSAQIGAQDRQSYLNDLMQKYQLGTGIGQNMYGTGANMAGQSAQQTQQMGENMGAAAFGRQGAGGDMFGNLLSAAGKLGTSWLTGGMGVGGMGRGMWSPTGG